MISGLIVLIIKKLKQDDTVRIWNLENGKSEKVIMMMMMTDPNIVSDSGFGFVKYIKDEIIACSYDCILMIYDLQTNSVIIKNPKTKIKFKSEINCLDFKDEYFLVASDDGLYEFKLSDLLDGNSDCIASRIIPQEDMISSALYRYDSCKNLEIIFSRFSGSLYKIKNSEIDPKLLIDFSKQQLVQINSDSTQIFNPPYIHDISINQSGTLVSLALGSGTIEIINLETGYISSHKHIHSSSVMTCDFLNFSPINYIVTSGSDLFIKVGEAFYPSEFEQNQLFELSNRLELVNQKVLKEVKKNSIQKKLLNSLENSLNLIRSKEKFLNRLKIVHPHKINFICTSSKKTKFGNLFVADLSNQIKCLSLNIE